MIKSIETVNGIINLKASAAVLPLYKQQFGAEYTEDCNNADDDTRRCVIGYQLVWCMARCADSSIPDPETWLRSFSGKLNLPAIIAEADELLHRSLGEHAKSGGQGEPADDKISEKLVGTALRWGFSTADLNDMTISFLLDCISAQADAVSGEEKQDDGVRMASPEEISALVRSFTS